MSILHYTHTLRISNRDTGTTSALSHSMHLSCWHYGLTTAAYACTCIQSVHLKQHAEVHMQMYHSPTYHRQYVKRNVHAWRCFWHCMKCLSYAWSCFQVPPVHRNLSGVTGKTFPTSHPWKLHSGNSAAASGVCNALNFAFRASVWATTLPVQELSWLVRTQWYMSILRRRARVSSSYM